MNGSKKEGSDEEGTDGFLIGSATMAADFVLDIAETIGEPVP